MYAAFQQNSHPDRLNVRRTSAWFTESGVQKMRQLQARFSTRLDDASVRNHTRKYVGWKFHNAIVLSLISFVGCGGSSDPVPMNANVPASESGSGTGTAVNSGSQNTTASDSDGSTKVKHGRDEVWVDAKGQKWFGNIPLDAFFDQPYTVASNTTPLGGTAATAVVSNAPTVESPGATATETPTSKPGTDPPATAAAGDSWGDLISPQVLDDEVKSIRNFLNENLQSVGVFNSSMLMIPPKAATLGALAGVAAEHPGAITWKEDATYIRNLAKKMNSDTLRSGPKDQKRLLELYEAASDTLNRSRPAGVEPLPEGEGFAEVSEMRLLMLRMSESEKRMKTEAGTDTAMNTRKDMVSHEAAIMATLAKIVTLPGYGYEDDPAFKAYANEVIKSALAVKGAAESNDFATYELALSKISTTCSSCHSEFKNN